MLFITTKKIVICKCKCIACAREGGRERGRFGRRHGKGVPVPIWEPRASVVRWEWVRDAKGSAVRAPMWEGPGGGPGKGPVSLSFLESAQKGRHLFL